MSNYPKVMILGGGLSASDLTRASRAIAAAGISVVVAAGNFGDAARKLRSKNALTGHYSIALRNIKVGMDDFVIKNPSVPYYINYGRKKKKGERKLRNYKL